MKTIERNPYVSLHLGEKIPAGYYLQKGQYLSRYAKLGKVPFGVCYDRVTNHAAHGKVIPIGLIIRNEHRADMDKALALRGTLTKQRK